MAAAAGALPLGDLRAQGKPAPATQPARAVPAPPPEAPLPTGAAARFGSIRLHHGTWVKSLAFSPNSRILASCGGQYNQPGDVSLWDVASGRLIRSMPAPVQGMGTVDFSPDGKTVLAAGMDRNIRFWDAATGKTSSKFRAGSVRGHWAIYGTDANTIAVSDGSNLHVVDAARGKTIRTIAKASACAFAPNGEELVATSMRDLNYGARIWNLKTGKLVRALKSDRQRLAEPAYSKDGRRLAIGCMYGTERGTIRLWNVAGGKLLGKLTGHGHYVKWVAFSPDGKLLASASQGGGVRVWDLGKLKMLRDLPIPMGQVYAAAFSPDGKLIAAGGMGGQIRVWRTDTWAERHAEQGHRGRVVAVGASDDGMRVVTGGQDGTARLWDGRTGTQRFRLQANETGISAAVISPDGRTMAACGNNDTVRIWEAATGTPRHSVKTPTHASQWIGFLPGGRKLIALGANGAASEIDAATGKVRPVCPGGKSAFTRVAMSADGRVAASCNRNLIYVWDLRTGRKIGLFGVPGLSHFYAIAIDRTGRLLAGDAGQKVALIELDSGKVVRHLAVPRRRVGKGALTFSHDGRTLAVSEWSGKIILWSVRTGKKLGERSGHRGAVTCMTFLPNGKGLLSGSEDGTAILWGPAGLEAPKPPAGSPLDDKGLAELWASLASTDAAKAQEAAFGLINAGRGAAAFLGKQLPSVAGPPPKEMHKLIANLGHRRFSVRKQATEKLASLGPIAEPALRQALIASISAEVRARAGQLLDALDDPYRRSGESVRQLRAVHVLESIRSKEAKSVLQRLSSGSPRANLTCRASAALERLTEGGR